MLWAKASPGGEAGSPQGLTDEVEVTNHNHELVRRCYLRPHPVRLEPDHHSRGMTATGSHIDFGFAARSTTLQGKAFSQKVEVFCVDFYRSSIATRRAGHAHAPTVPRRGILPALRCHGGRHTEKGEKTWIGGCNGAGEMV